MPSRLEPIIGVLDETIIIGIIIVVILWGFSALDFMSLTDSLIVGIVCLITLALFAYLILKPQLQKPMIGPETYIGKMVKAATDLNPDGLISIDGEYWSAVSRELVKEGEYVEVLTVMGLKLKVKKVNTN